MTPTDKPADPALVERLKAALALAPSGESTVLEAERAWAEHVARDHPVLTLYGAYDAGKSSLLKRLLVEEGQPVPDWLTISGRPETFEINTVKAAGCLLKDTPGIQAGVDLHEAQTASALLLTDGFLVVLLPKLLTSEKAPILDLLSGRVFHPDGFPFPQGGLIPVVNRFDEAGADPVDDEEGYRELASAKQQEWRSALASEGLDVQASIPLRVIAADPFQMMGPRTNASSAEFDAFRSWDGVGGLADDLERLGDRLPTLRAAAEARYWTALGVQVYGGLGAVASETRRALQSARSHVQRKVAFSDRLDALVQAAQADLVRVVNEEMLSASRGSLSKAEDLVAELQQRLGRQLARWDQKHWAAVVALVEEFTLEVSRQAERPSAEAFSHLFTPPSASDKADGPKTYEEEFDLLNKVATAARTALQLKQEHDLGMTFAEVGTELRKLRDLQGDKLTEYFTKRRGFTSEEAAQRAGKLIGKHELAKHVGGALLELGPLVVERVQEARARVARAKRRRELRDEVRRLAQAIADAYWDGDPSLEIEGWKEHVTRLRSDVDDLFRTHDKAEASLAESLEELEHARTALAETLRLSTPTA